MNIRITRAVIFFSIAFFLSNFVLLAQSDLANKVLVVYNSSYVADQDQDGVQDGLGIAMYYQNARSVPSENIIGISAPVTEEISRAQFDAAYDSGNVYENHLKQDLQNYLSNTFDGSGICLKNKIRYIVLVKGMPLKIKLFGSGTDVYTADYSSVDAALALLFQNYDIKGRVSNPYFNLDPNNTVSYRFESFKYSNSQVTLSYLVTRLDGYTALDIKRMIDKAIAPDSPNGSEFVVDDALKPYDFMYSCYFGLKNAGQKVNPDPWVDNSSWITASSLKVMGYVSHGVHAGMPADYITSTLSFQYANGALFSSYESSNGASYSIKGAQGQVADFIGSGGTGGIGNVYDPWSSGVAHEEVLFPMYAIGYNLAEAAYLSLQYLDWTTTVAGDPLCQIAAPSRSITADFAAQSVNGFAPLTVTFNDKSVAYGTSITSWSWDFNNDGVVDSREKNPSFAFTQSGNYSVRLAVSDGSISHECFKIGYINVSQHTLLDSTAVIFATNAVSLQSNAKIISGGIIVNKAGEYPILGSADELTVNTGVTTSSKYSIKANRVSILSNTTVSSPLYYNNLSNNGTITGTLNPSLSLPVISQEPTFNIGTYGTQTILVKKGSITLAPGNYLDIIVNAGCKVILTGGLYNVRSISLYDNAQMQFAAKTEIRVMMSLKTQPYTFIGPKPKTKVKASQIVFHITGTDNLPQYAVQLGNSSTVNANIYAKNGTISAGDGSKLKGAYFGKNVIIGAGVQVTLDSYINTPGSLYKNETESGEQYSGVPTAFRMNQNYPNPFNPTTTISFTLATEEFVTLKVYNILGQEIRSLVNGNRAAGEYSILWDGRNNQGNQVSSGIYLCKIKAGSFTHTTKMTFTK